MTDSTQNSLGIIARKIADAKSKREIYSILVNELKPIFLFDQAAIVKKTIWGTQKIEAINGLIDIEHSGPYPVWLRRLVRGLSYSGSVETFDSNHSANPGNWEKFSSSYAISIPLTETYLTQKISKTIYYRYGR